MSEYKPQAGDRVEITLTALIEKRVPHETFDNDSFEWAELEDVEVLHAAPASQE